MAEKLHILVRRGLESNLPILKDGELGFTSDTKKLFIGSTTGNIRISTWSQLEDALSQQLADLETRIDTEVSTLNGRIDTEVSTLSTSLANHISAITAHDVTQITNAESVTGSQAKVDAHANRIDNPHSVTTEQINAYTKTATDTNIATSLQAGKTYTDNAISALVGGSPSLLDTLYELSNALGNDPNFSTTVLNQISAVDTKITTHATHMNPIIAAIVFGG
jgi:hypothetical protein